MSQRNQHKREVLRLETFLNSITSFTHHKAVFAFTLSALLHPDHTSRYTTKTVSFIMSKGRVCL